MEDVNLPFCRIGGRDTVPSVKVCCPMILYQTLNQGHLAQSKELYMVAQDRILCFDQYELIREGL